MLLFIKIVSSDLCSLNDISESNVKEIINAEGLYLFPGMIDDQVHFREPGLTNKGTINSESKAAIAGGVTSYIEMPNTIPQTITVSEYDKKRFIANKSSSSYSTIWSPYSCE